MSEQRKPRRRGLRANYQKASPKKAAEAVLRVRTEPGMKSKRFINPNR